MASAKKPAKSRSVKAMSTSPNTEVFIAEYLRDSNGKRAAIAAGYSPKTAAQQASRLLKNVNVRSRLNKQGAEVVERIQIDTRVTLDRVVREIARGAFYDPRKLFDATGKPKGIHELGDDDVAMLQGFEVSVVAGKPAVMKYRLIDRKGNLDMLMKHLGGYDKDNVLAVTVKPEKLSDIELAKRIAFKFAKASAQLAHVNEKELA